MTILDFNSARKQSELLRTGIDAADIRERLHADPLGFVKWLYSGRAYVSRNQARIGNVHGEQGSSLAIDLATGLWKDHATDEGGDLISLYRAWRGHGDGNFELSLKEIAADYLGDPIEVIRPTWEPTPTARIAEQKVKLGDKPRDENIQLGAPVATYLYYDLHGQITASVVRFEPNGRESKTFRPWCFKPVEGKQKWAMGAPGKQKWAMGAPDIRPLYRLPEVAAATTVVLCEGEGCADALASVGIVATSAMQGAKAPIEKTDWTPLAGKTVIVWPDKDHPGFDYAHRVSERLLALGCKVLGVTPPETAPDKWDAADCVAEGGDPHGLIGAALPVAPEPSGDVFKLYTLEELEELPAPRWLIDGVMVENGICLFWAGSDSYKTFVAIDMSFCIGTGADWHGHKVSQGPVVYVAAEDITGVTRRMIGWRETKGRELPKAKVTLLNDSFTMASPDADKLIRSIKLLPERPRLIVIDTLARSFGAGNEDKTQDMNAFILACDKVRRATGATIMIVHHTGRNTEQERGNISLRAACDTIFTVARVGKSGKIKLINSPPKGKQKNAEPFKDIMLRMQQTSFEYKGAEQSTLVVMSDDAALPTEEPETGEDEQNAGHGQIQQAILTCLRNAARSDRGGLGFTSLSGQVRGDKGSFGRALRRLIEKGKVSETIDETDPKKERSIYTIPK